MGIDGCSIPSYAVPLSALALGFARFGTGHGFGPERAKAAARIRKAVAAHPFMVAGTGRFDTRAMEQLGARLFTKTGAEGVYCGALPELGYGIALKCDDGAGRAAEIAMAALIARFLPMSEAEARAFAPLRENILKNWNGVEVGRVRAAAF
jgi:L-asparaginase II